jgi:hypothetical protein
MTDIPKKLLKPKDVAEQLGITTRTLFRWDEEGSFKARRLPNGRKYYLQGDVDGLIGAATTGLHMEVPTISLSPRECSKGFPNFEVASICEAGMEDFYKACEKYHDKLTEEKPSDFIDRMESPLEVIIHAEDYGVGSIKEAVHLIERAWENYTSKRTKGNCYGGV